MSMVDIGIGITYIGILKLKKVQQHKIGNRHLYRYNKLKKVQQHKTGIETNEPITVYVLLGFWG